MRASSTKEIVLERQNTLLLMSAMRGGLARRHAYTNAFAEELRLADGKKDVYEMHTGAVSRVRAQHGEDQTPEMRTTLKKKLILARK